MPAKKATHQQTKQHNRDLILKTLFDNPQISRAEIARTTKLTRATVSDMVADLIDEGLVTEVGYGSSIGGRLPVLLSLNADSRYLIGLNLAQDKFIGAVVNLRGEIKETCEAPVGSNNGEQALQTVYQILDQLLATDWKPIVGIGVGTPGLVNARDGIVVNAVNLDWKDLPLAHLLESRYRLPVSVLNDSQAMAIGEFVYSGEYKSDDNLIVVNVGYGIGAGILINGRILTCFGEPWLESVRETMSQAALPRMVQDTQLEIGKLDFRGCILGASASMLLNGYSLLFTQTNIN